MIPKPTCVLLDTNAWRSNLLLRTAMGSALLFTVNRASHKLALPEVIEDEIEKHAAIAAREAKDRIARSFRDIQAILGRHGPYRLPSEEEVQSAIRERFEELNGLIIRIPFKLEHAKAALHRVSWNIPPSSTKKQQFKDSCVWEAAMELADSYDIMLVSDDGDFYRDKNRIHLDSALQKEVDESGNRIRVYSGLNKCLEHLQRDRPTLDFRYVAEMIVAGVRQELELAVAKDNLKPSDIKDYEIKSFITEDHDRLAVEYAITLDVINTDVSPLNAGAVASVTVEGTCVYKLSDQVADENHFNTVRANWIDSEGKAQQTRGVYLRVTDHIGRQSDIPYETRIELREG